MDDIHEDLKVLREYLYDAHLEDGGTDINFTSLVTMETQSPELKEIIILLHSNYTGEFQAIKQHNLRVHLKLLDNQDAAFKKVIDKIMENSKTRDKNKFSFTIKVFSALGALGIFLAGMFYLFAGDKEAGKLVIELMKSIPKLW